MRGGPAVVVLAAALVAGAAVVPVTAAAAQSDAEPSFVVDLHPDGGASVTVTYTFDLAGESERRAFRELRDNDSAREAFAARFRDRMRAVAANAENATGREMTVENATADFESGGDTGVVRLSADWHGLAAVEDGDLLLSEPFASDFAPDRRFVVDLPDQYAVENATPEPDSAADGRLVWATGSDLDGFEVVAAEEGAGPDTDQGSDGATGADAADADDGSVGATEGSGPGFGPVAALAALLGTVLLGRAGE